MRCGVNYIPRKNWLHFWLDFDADSVREDIKTLREIGFDHIRAHLIWSYFQPNEGYMSQHCLNNLSRFVRICEEEHMDFFLTLFTGFMSGFYYFPAFLKRDNSFAMFTSKAEIEAECFYIKGIGKVVANSSAFLGFDLGNELSCVTPMQQYVTKKNVDEWQRIMYETCEMVAPGKLHNNGVDHQPWFNAAWPFSRESLANLGALTPLHCWTEFTRAREHGGLLGKASILITDFMSQLALAYANEPNRMVWIQEFGCSSLWSDSEEQMEEFMIKALNAISGIQNCWGFTLWCSHDLSPTLKGYAELEYDLGILDTNNRPKPYAAAVSKWIEQHRANKEIPAVRSKACIFQPEKPIWENIEKFLAYTSNENHIALVLPEKASDADYLASRGIIDIL